MASKLGSRISSVIARIKPGEGLPVAILLLDLFLILTAYYLLKVAREPLILLGGGAEVKSYAAAGQALLLVALVPLYGMVGSKVKRLALVDGVMALFAASFVVFWLLMEAGVAIGVPFYLWLGIFNMLVIAQFWSLANELFSQPQGERLFPIIAFGGTLGAIAGSWIAGQLVGALGIGALMVIAAGLLVACIALTTIGSRVAHRDTTDPAKLEQPLDKKGGFRLVAVDRYLRVFAIAIVLYNVVNTLGEYILGSVVTATAKAEAGGNVELAKQLVGEFYGGFFTWVNIVAAVIQLFFVGRVVKFLGVRVALLLVPALALGSYGLLATVPVLAWIRFAKITENSLDYSLHNTVRQMLWLPTSPEAKYKAKAAIDTFFVRAGDVIAAGLVAAGGALALSPRGFAIANLGIVAAWLAVAVLVGREHDRLAAKQPREQSKTPVPSRHTPPPLGKTHGRAPA